MAKYRKLGCRTDVRLALLRSRVTVFIANGKVVTTETGTKEVRKMVELPIALIVKKKDNSETVSVTAKMLRKDVDGKRVREEKDGKRIVVCDMVQKEIKKSKPSRMNARRHMLAKLYTVGELDPKRRRAGRKADLVVELFDEHGLKYESRESSYTRIVKTGLRKGDTVVEVLFELV